ncbi:MAG: type II secretion system F family protein [Candidatus Omnitrophica bacterium]|nr:type II secretion system F family protein [Candidatus Omnitrophota bacterium]
MLILPLLLVFLSVFALILGFTPLSIQPKLKLDLPVAGGEGFSAGAPAKKRPLDFLFGGIRKIAFFNKPFTNSALGQRIFRDLMLSQVRLSVEEFFLIKQALALGLVWVALKFYPDKNFMAFGILMSMAGGYLIPEIWLHAKVRKIKAALLKDLPDTVDLLGLCVNAGLDFMMALKYVVEKSPPTVITEELKLMMQEINVGKLRRDALRDLSRKYEMPDLSTFTRTLIQADRMGTSVSEALNILSEDMRETRFRRGETMALKAPLKMLVPLLFCIFPVVALLVAGPVFLDFFHNNPLRNLGR